MVKNELYHHGVKGMKWGVRKDPVRLKKQDTLALTKENVLLLNRLVIIKYLLD